MQIISPSVNHARAICPPFLVAWRAVINTFAPKHKFFFAFRAKVEVPCSAWEDTTVLLATPASRATFNIWLLCPKYPINQWRCGLA